MNQVGVIERAFQLAPHSDSLRDLKRKLIQEGYSAVELHLGGAQIKRDLKPHMARVEISKRLARPEQM